MANDNDSEQKAPSNDFCSSVMSQLPTYEFMHGDSGLNYSFMVPAATPESAAPVSVSTPSPAATSTSWTPPAATTPPLPTIAESLSYVPPVSVASEPTAAAAKLIPPSVPLSDLMAADASISAAPFADEERYPDLWAKDFDQIESFDNQPHSTSEPEPWIKLEDDPQAIWFTHDFDFNKSLIKIFWRLDVDKNNRVSLMELAQALDEHWFAGDDEVLARALYRNYDAIATHKLDPTFFADMGISVEEILVYPLFARFAVQHAPARESQIAAREQVRKKSRNSLRELQSKSFLDRFLQ